MIELRVKLFLTSNILTLELTLVGDEWLLLSLVC